MGFLSGSALKNPPAMQEMQVRSLGQKISWRRAWHPTPVGIAWRLLWTEEPGGLQSMELQESDMTYRLNHQPPKCRVWDLDIFFCLFYF